MNELEEEILKVLEPDGKKVKMYTSGEIAKRVKGNMKQVYKALKNLIDTNVIYSYSDRFSVIPPTKMNVTGILHINKYGEGFVENDSLFYYIDSKNLNDALEGDTVTLKATNKIKKGKIVSRIDEIIERKDGLLIVEVTKNAQGEVELIPMNNIINYPIKMNKDCKKVLVEGDRIIVKIDLPENNIYIAEFVKNIGHKDDPDADLKLIAINNNIPIEFSLEALKEAENIPDVVLEEEKKGRLDLTNKLIFSIDGANTKDRDDAISLEINEKGNYVLGVHIADVTHYIYPGMKLWKEALMRATSVYMVNTVIPMLPHKLSNGICSLNPNEDRLTSSCFIELTPNGQIINYEFCDSVINSRKAMTYEEVNILLEEGKILDGYEEFYDNLKEMEKLSSMCERIKQSRGYVNFGTHEVQIKVDEKGNPIEFNQRKQGTAEKIIENFMLLANECYATFVNIPTPYRVHESPEEDKVEDAFDLLDKSGFKVRSSQDIINGKVIQKILTQIKDMTEREVAANIILRSMNRAKYDVVNNGHFGLGLKNYGHWTSPIRRAADLTGHYCLKLQRDGKFMIKDAPKFYDTINELCHYISKKERNANDAERQADKYEMCKYMANHIGEKFNAHITFINSKSIAVKTEEGIEGQLLPKDIEGDTFDFNKNNMYYKGKETKQKLKMGTKLVLTVLEANKKDNSIYFRMEEEDLPYVKVKK